MAFVMMGPAGLRNDMVSYFKELVSLAPQADKDAFTNCKFPKWTGRPLFQHAWNLGWAGAFSWLCIWLIFEPNSLLPVISLVPWLADVGYFMAIDIPELGGAPAQAQTYIVTAACICGSIVTADHFTTPCYSLGLQIAGFSTLALAAFINKIMHLTGAHPYARGKESKEPTIQQQSAA